MCQGQSPCVSKVCNKPSCLHVPADSSSNPLSVSFFILLLTILLNFSAIQKSDTNQLSAWTSGLQLRLPLRLYPRIASQHFDQLVLVSNLRPRQAAQIGERHCEKRDQERNWKTNAVPLHAQLMNKMPIPSRICMLRDSSEYNRVILDCSVGVKQQGKSE